MVLANHNDSVKGGLRGRLSFYGKLLVWQISMLLVAR
jgi:hypothetical protein